MHCNMDGQIYQLQILYEQYLRNLRSEYERRDFALPVLHTAEVPYVNRCTPCLFGCNSWCLNEVLSRATSSSEAENGIRKKHELQVACNDKISCQSQTRRDSQVNSTFSTRKDISNFHKVETPVKWKPKPKTTPLGFSCPMCNKIYSYRSSLNVHMRKHTGSKPYRCHYCPKAFSQSGNLKVHMRIHTGERPYPCSYCPKKFKQLAALRSHMYIHNNAGST